MGRIFYFLFVFVSINTFSQNHLNEYINIALESNLALQQKQASYEKSIQALKEARGMFFPSVSINARYTRAEGGRMIEFPVGDMLNPVYSNLNGLNEAFGVDNPIIAHLAQFPLDNQEFAFYREKEHETKVRVVQPILNSQIYYNNKIKSNLANMEKASYEAYQRQLVYEVKSAYYQYFQTIEVLNLISNTGELLNENIRVNNKLYENGMVTIDYLYRSEVELNKLNQANAEAVKNNKLAHAYFNFLLNRDLNSEIFLDTSIIAMDSILSFENAKTLAVENREEIKQLEYAVEVNENMVHLNKSNAMPTITGVVDYGYQGEEYIFTNDDDFMLASIVLQWDLFKGMQNKRKIQQAKIDKDIISKKLEETKKQINLQIINSFYEVEAASKKVDASISVVESSLKTFQIIRKKFNQGQASLIEFIDARTSLTNAQEGLIISNYDYQVKYAEFERVACLYPLNVYENN